MSNYDTQEMQLKYERWRELYRHQIEAQKKWLEAEALLTELQAYYQSPKWRQDYDNNVPVDCNNGEYCVTNEDTLWDMLIDRDEQAKRWIRLGLDAIDD